MLLGDIMISSDWIYDLVKKGYVDIDSHKWDGWWQYVMISNI